MKKTTNPNKELPVYPANQLFQTHNGQSWQCDLTNRIHLQFGNSEIAFQMRDFSVFQRRVLAVDIHKRIYDLSDSGDFEVIEAPRQGFSLHLSLCELVQLRELVSGTKFALMLNSTLHELLGGAVLA